jgi:predicted dehydrogenase/threonine dehydrogenase-like Zn-dependent dehydrogenase
MKQVLQNLKTGETTLVDVPAPSVYEGTIVVQSLASLISTGTERMLLDFGKSSLLEKARQQPDKVKMVLDKVRTDGLFMTLDAVKSKLDQPLPLGYCNAGRVLEVGSGVDRFKAGDRVVSNGSHAEVVRVAKNLVAPIPDSVSDEEAAFVVLSSIGLQGIRLAQPTLGEAFVVIGVGLIGLITVQLLRIQGCRVLAIDFDKQKLKLAATFGAEVCNLSENQDPVQVGMAFSHGRGVDGVIITASTKSSDPVSQAAKMSRKRGRIVLVGVTGLELSRADFYEKELTFQVSCSYGPGRYDSNYEEKGKDYPFGFVRWTEQRNFEAILNMMADGRLNVKPFISYRFSFDDAVQAYETLNDDKHTLGIILQYPDTSKESLTVKQVTLKRDITFNADQPVCGFIGAGNYASRVLIPAYKKAGAQLHTIISSGGVSATHHGKKNGFYKAATDIAEVLENDEINTIVIATRHNTHAGYVIDALMRGKNVFVEKPLALQDEDLDTIERVYREHAISAGIRLMVGFNRRFAPQVVKIKALLESINQPKSFIMTMNAGAIPANTWVQDIEVGGGRIIGEACHYVDLMRHLAGAEITSIQTRRMGDRPGIEVTEDKATIVLGFKNGSFGTIHYLANGGKIFPKERIEIFAGDAVLQLDNFRKLKGFGWKNFKKLNLMHQDKGQDACVAAFLESIQKGNPAPIPFDELMEVSRVSIEIARQLHAQE